MNLRSNFSYLVIFLLGSVLLLIISCGKEHSRNGTEEEQEMQSSKVSSESDGEAEIIFNGLFDDAIGVNTEVGIGGTGIFGRTQTCPTVTVVHTAYPAVFPIRVTLDFGTTGCTPPNDPHVRKGKIIIEYTNRLIEPGARAITSFENFYVDSVHVEGHDTITNTSTPGTNIPANRSFRHDVDGKLTRPSGNYTLWTSHKTITQFEGLSTPQMPLDDQFRIEGSAHGKVLRSNLLVDWESNIIEPLIKKFTCRWIVKGKIRTVRRTLATTSPWVAVLDFGTGNCDNQAIITINGVPHQITLP